ncbi:Succinate-semialdehyde dehydrogenase (acetylating) [[Clostridium] ultunense Esp]|nr:Succinate-semialdehyde dehydrogenase (acetylating) [[Clostridium] ultunense Esp]
MNYEKYVKELIKKSRVAQKQFEKFNQKEVDELVKATGKTVYDNAAELARMAVEETGMGVYEDKLAKNKGKAKTIWNDLKNKNSVGIIERDEAVGIVKIAKPMGVVASVTPTTNPIVTVMSNVMFALKGRNSIIIAPHPRAKECSSYTVKLINRAIVKYHAPENLIQIIEEPKLELTNKLMQMADVTVATGGSGMVKAAYSSGKPAYGVGPGNVQCIIDRYMKIDKVVEYIITGRSFDNGIICSGEQSVIAHEDDYNKIIEQFKNNNCYYIEDSKEKEAIRNTLFPDGIMNKDVVGQSAYKIGQMAGIPISKDTKVILIEADGIGEKDLLCKEKMCPVLATFRYKNFKEAVKIAQTNLEFEGTGHSAVIHSNNIDHIEYAGEKLKVSRLVVNQPCSTTAGGSLYNGFAPTTTLGCGSWGNNSISENFTYKHMVNITRIGYLMKDRDVPTDEEIWR